MTEKNRVIIHIGLPKTASTTLQDRLFYDLSQKGIINYLGNSLNDFSELPNGKKLKKCYKIFLEEVLNSEITHNSFMYNCSKSKTNILSEEWLSLPDEVYFLRKYKNSIDKIIPKVLKYFTSQKTDIYALVIIRNQATLIPSFFAQCYGWYLSYLKINCLTKYLNHIMNMKENFKVFYFDQLLSILVRNLGKEKVKVMFFEDIIYNKDIFYNELAEFLQIEVSLINNILSKSHLNKKVKTKKGIITNSKRSLLITLFKHFFPEQSQLYKWYQKLKKNNPENFIIKIYRKLISRKNVVPFFNAKEEKLVYDEFFKSNNKLWQEYGIDKDRLKKYKYI